MIIGITGHRPQSIGGFKANPLQDRVKLAIHEFLKENKPELIITGMALGVDTWAAQSAIELGIPFEAAIPFADQFNRWPEDSVKEYKRLLELAAKVTIVSPGGFSAEKMHIRNMYIVQKCNLLLAVYNGQRSGGTFQAVEFAKSVNKPIHVINPSEI